MNEFESDGFSLSQSFVKNGWIQDGRIQDGCHHQVESDWMSEDFFVQMVGTNLGKCEWVSEKKVRWLNPRCGIQVGRIQDGCHHQVRWEGMSLNQIELVWFRVRLEWECFWVNIREDNKVSESKLVVSESSMAQFKIAAIIKLSQNEWVKFFLYKWWESMLASVSEFERKN